MQKFAYSTFGLLRVTPVTFLWKLLIMKVHAYGLFIGWGINKARDAGKSMRNRRETLQAGGCTPPDFHGPEGRFPCFLRDRERDRGSTAWGLERAVVGLGEACAGAGTTPYADGVRGAG